MISTTANRIGEFLEPGLCITAINGQRLNPAAIEETWFDWDANESVVVVWFGKQTVQMRLYPGAEVSMSFVSKLVK